MFVEFKKVSKCFGSKKLIDNISFAIHRNTLTTLIGPNGAGKTTIAKLLLGLDKIYTGQIVLPSKIKIGYVPQKLNFEAHLPITAKQFLKIIAPNYDSGALAYIENYINLKQIKSKDISKLSGGQVQKLMIGAALLNKPDLIILDEPTQSLDLISQQEFYELIGIVRNSWQPTIFMISHDLFTVMKTSDHVICINGHICCSGKPCDFNTNQEFANSLSSIGFYAHHHNHKH